MNDGSKTGASAGSESGIDLKALLAAWQSEHGGDERGALLARAGRACLYIAKYEFDDASLTVGAAYWTRLVERYLPRETA